jgi:hypothetical protein
MHLHFIFLYKKQEKDNMAATSFQFRYPLNRNPYVAEAGEGIIYPYARWGDFATSSNFYVYGKQIPERSFFGEDLNLSARPITRLVQPPVLAYESLQPSCPLTGLAMQSGQGGAPMSPMVETLNPIIMRPVVNSRYAVYGAQTAEEVTQKRTLMILLSILALAGLGTFFVLRK